jgi:hypothetical protein
MHPAQCGTMLPLAALQPLLMLLLPMLLRCPSAAAQASAMYWPLGNHPPVQDATEPSLE